MKFDANKFFDDGIAIFQNESMQDWGLFKGKFEETFATSDFQKIHLRKLNNNINPKIKLDIFFIDVFKLTL